MMMLPIATRSAGYDRSAQCASGTAHGSAAQQHCCTHLCAGAASTTTNYQSNPSNATTTLFVALTFGTVRTARVHPCSPRHEIRPFFGKSMTCTMRRYLMTAHHARAGTSIRACNKQPSSPRWETSLLFVQLGQHQCWATIDCHH